MVRPKNIIMKAFMRYESIDNFPIGYIYVGEFKPDGFIEMTGQSFNELKEYPELVNLLKSLDWDSLRNPLHAKLVEV